MPSELIRSGIFLAVFLLLALYEHFRPRLPLRTSKKQRWLTNISLILLDNLTLAAMALIGPLVAYQAAVTALQYQIGVFHQIDAPLVVAGFISIILLDMAIWFQHLVMHKVDLLWHLHRVHHADRDIDVTTGIRFHPIEMALSMLWKVAVVFFLGVPVVAIIIYEALLSSMALFSHANIYIPLWLEKRLRLVIITPDMHRVHHSVIRSEHDSNYGNFLSIWDRIFRTYTAAPKDGQEGMKIGLSYYQNDAPARLGWALKNPFHK